MGHGVDSCHSYNAAHSKKKKKKRKKKKKNQPNKIKENKEGEPRNKGSKYKVQSNLFHCINLSAIKTNERFTF